MTPNRALCRLCSSSISPFMSFGRMPIANGFLTVDEVPSEYFFELAPAFCNVCGLFQIVDQPAPEKMFHESYAFFSSTSRHMQVHFAAFAEQIISRVLTHRMDPFVVELGSNDGIMLGHFKDAGFRHLGVEPSTNVADVALAKGIHTISSFFGVDLARQIVSEHGRADAVLAANVLCHIPDINGVASGIAQLLKPDGVLTFEDPYLGDVIEKTSYDQIYDEHVFLFSATSVVAAFGRHGLELVDVLPQGTHGGSMRYMLAPRGTHAVSPRVAPLLDGERARGLHLAATYDRFRLACEASRSALKELLERLRDDGKRIVGYAATSKSTTVTNYCAIGPELIEFISDTTPIKQGKLSPGAHIPVKSREAFAARYPDYALLFAWNHAAEIFAKELEFKTGGGKWISFVPRVEILP